MVGASGRPRQHGAAAAPAEAGDEEDGSKGRKQFADFRKKEKKVIINTYELRH